MELEQASSEIKALHRQVYELEHMRQEWEQGKAELLALRRKVLEFEQGRASRQREEPERSKLGIEIISQNRARQIFKDKEYEDLKKENT
jgi:hypothetical protein